MLRGSSDQKYYLFIYVRAFPEHGKCKDLVPYKQHPGVKHSSGTENTS